MLQAAPVQASAERDVGAAAAASVDLEYPSIMEDVADPDLPEALNFDLQMPDMSKVSADGRETRRRALKNHPKARKFTAVVEVGFTREQANNLVHLSGDC